MQYVVAAVLFGIGLSLLAIWGGLLRTGQLEVGSRVAGRPPIKRKWLGISAAIAILIAAVLILAALA